MSLDQPSPEEYVEENIETLVYIVKHSANDFVRALALAAIIEYGDNPSKSTLAEDLERLVNEDRHD